MNSLSKPLVSLWRVRISTYIYTICTIRAINEYLTIIPRSYTTRANGIIVLLYRQIRYFCCCVVKQLRDFLLVHFSKTFSPFFSLFFSLLVGYEMIASFFIFHSKNFIFRNLLTPATLNVSEKQPKLWSARVNIYNQSFRHGKTK